MVADNTLTIKQKSILPVSKTRQGKSLFCSLSDTYLPPSTWSRCVVLAAVRPPVARPPQPHPVLARPSAASASARCEPVPAFPLLPGPSPCLARPSAAPTSARCEPFLANSLLPGPSTHPAWPSAASASARCEPFPTNRLTPAPPNRTSPACLIAKAPSNSHRTTAR